MRKNKKKIIKLSLKEFKRLIAEETIKSINEASNNADICVGVFYCYEDDKDYATMNEDTSNIGFYHIKKKKSDDYKYEVWVYHLDDGQIPHMHIINKKKRFESCVRLETPQYFLHKPYHKPMTKKVVDSFYEFMKANNVAYSDMGDIPNYNIAVGAWNSNSDRSRVKVTKDEKGKVIIPNYQNLPIK